jgi:hypothetical protein
LLDPELDLVDPELDLVDPELDLVDPEPSLVDPEPALLDPELVDSDFVDSASVEASDPLLAASAARDLRRAWACLAMRSPEALPLFSFRAAVARLTEAASRAAAWALRGLLAVVAMSSAQQATDLLSLLPYGLDLAGEFAELLTGLSDLARHSAQVNLLGHRDTQDLALVPGLAGQQSSTHRADGGAEHRHAEIGEGFALAAGSVGRLLAVVRVGAARG